MIRLIIVFTLWRYKVYIPTETKVTLDGETISKVLNKKPVYIVFDNKKYILECAVEHKDCTLLYAGKEVGTVC